MELCLSLLSVMISCYCTGTLLKWWKMRRGTYSVMAVLIELGTILWLHPSEVFWGLLFSFPSVKVNKNAWKAVADKCPLFQDIQAFVGFCCWRTFWTYLNWAWWYMETCIPSYLGGWVRRSQVQGRPGLQSELIWKLLLLPWENFKNDYLPLIPKKRFSLALYPWEYFIVVTFPLKGEEISKSEPVKTPGVKAAREARSLPIPAKSELLN